MIRPLKRAWCRRYHQAAILPTVLGGLLCQRCRMAYADAMDAGRIYLDEYERMPSVAWLIAFQRTAETEPERFERRYADARQESWRQRRA